MVYPYTPPTEIPEDEQKKILEEILDVPHNFISKETLFGTDLFVHRKGAIYVPEGTCKKIWIWLLHPHLYPAHTHMYLFGCDKSLETSAPTLP